MQETKPDRLSLLTVNKQTKEKILKARSHFLVYPTFMKFSLSEQ